MTGWPRWVIMIISLVVAIVSVLLSLILVGAVNFCGLAENQAPGGYCAASQTTRTAVVVIPLVTIALGYGLTVRAGRLQPVGVGALMCLAEGLTILLHWGP
jgi:hypothetical protein